MINLIPWGKPALEHVRKYGENRTPGRLKGRVIGLDTEATGFDGYEGARIFCYSYCTEEGEKGWIPRTKATNQWVFDILRDSRNKVVFQNGKHDLSLLQFEGFDINEMKAEYHDTLAMGVLMSELSSHELGDMVRQWLGEKVDIKSTAKEWLRENGKAFTKKHGRKPNFSDIPNDIMGPYAQWDPIATLKLFFYFLKPIQNDFSKLYKNELYLLLMTIRMRKRGVVVNLETCRKLRKKARSDRRWMVRKMRRLVGRDFIIAGSGSKTDMLNVIQKDLGWEITIFTAKGNPQTDEFAMLSFVDKRMHLDIKEKTEELRPREYIQYLRKKMKKLDIDRKQMFVPLLLKWRELNKMINTYYDSILERAIPMKKYSWLGILRGKFNSLGAITGRFTSSDPNLQNIPRIMGPRECFVPRPGYVNYHLDYSQIEVRVYVEITKDKHLRAVLMDPKGDIHMATAIKMFRLPAEKISKERRKRAKVTRFGIQYGSGARKLGDTLTRAGIPTNTSEAKTILDAYHRAEPSLRRAMSQCKAELMRKGYVEDIYGRRYRVPLRFSYKALNSKTQGGAGNVMKFAMSRVDRKLRKLGSRSQIISTIHDELILETHKSEESWAPALAKKIMERDSPKFFVPIVVEVEKVTDNWAKKIPVIFKKKSA